MKKVLLVALLFVVSFVNAAEKQLGKAITLKDKTSVSKILSCPSRFRR